MQLRLNPQGHKNQGTKKLAIKVVLFIFVFFLAIFLLDKIEIKAPTKLIKQQLSNDKLITLK